jgi:hypothetical protein
MPSDGNGTVWRVAFGGTVGKDLKVLYQQAKAAGLGQAYIGALKFAIQRIGQDPMAFGELVRRLPKSAMIVHVRIIRPLLIEFAIHEESHRVLIQRVELTL